MDLTHQTSRHGPAEKSPPRHSKLPAEAEKYALGNICAVLATEKRGPLKQSWTQKSVEDYQGSKSGGKTWGRAALKSFMQKLELILLEISRQFVVLTTLTRITKQPLWGWKRTNYPALCTSENRISTQRFILVRHTFWLFIPV